MPDEPEVAGLLALLLLTESRRAARRRSDGSLVVLGEQDRGLWDRPMIQEGQALVRGCLRRNDTGAIKFKPQSTLCMWARRPSSRPIGGRSSHCTTSYWQLPRRRSLLSIERSPSARYMALPRRSRSWRIWIWKATTRSTPREPIFCDGWAGRARPPPPTSVRQRWPQPKQSGISSGAAAAQARD